MNNRPHLSHRFLRAHAVAALALLASTAFVRAAEPSPRPATAAEFSALLEQVAGAWNANDAARAAAAFHEDAIYSEPPDRQLYRGRKELFEFFGGANGRKDWMRMTWHHLSFNPATQVGAGEFTFAWPGGQAHGMVSIKLRDGLIGHWREYFHTSPLAWEDFQGPNRF